jgi:hypothetical protein
VSGVLKIAYRAGIPTREFWEQTPFETRLCVEAYNDQRLDEDERSMHTAWHTAYFHRVKDMPRLSEMLAPYRKAKGLTVKEAARAAKASSGSEASAPDPDMSRNLMNALLQFPAGKVPGERIGSKPDSSEAPPA